MLTNREKLARVEQLLNQYDADEDAGLGLALCYIRLACAIRDEEAEERRAASASADDTASASAAQLRPVTELRPMSAEVHQLRPKRYKPDHPHWGEVAAYREMIRNYRAALQQAITALDTTDKAKAPIDDYWDPDRGFDYWVDAEGNVVDDWPEFDATDKVFFASSWEAYAAGAFFDDDSDELRAHLDHRLSMVDYLLAILDFDLEQGGPGRGSDVELPDLRPPERRKP